MNECKFEPLCPGNQPLQPPDAAALLTAAADVDASLTVFAPTDAAFEALLADLGIEAGDLLNDPNLPAILRQHILGTTVGSLTAYASNGVIHVIDKVIFTVD